MGAFPAPVMRSRGAARGIAAALLLALALTAVVARPATAATRRRPPRKPDLAISGVTFDDHALEGGTDAMTFCGRATNAGTAPTAGGVELVLALVEPDGTSHARGKVAVGRLWQAGARLRNGRRLPHSVHDCSRQVSVAGLPLEIGRAHV